MPLVLPGHLATSADGDILAAALFEHTVLLWNTTTGDCISQFETVLDFGGIRLALSEAESACLAAAYYVHGLACYDTPSGALRWQRCDLKKVQQIVVTADGRHAYCCLEDRPCQIVSISNGETTDKLRGVRGIWIDTQSGLQLHESAKLTVVDGQKKVFRIVPDSFAVLDASFSHNRLAVSESGADVRIFDLSSGHEVLRHTQPKNHHILELSSVPDDSVFHGVQWNYNEGGHKLLLRLSADAEESEIIRDLGEPAEVSFCHGGRWLVTSEGGLIDCRSGETLRRFDFPQAEYPRAE